MRQQLTVGQAAPDFTAVDVMGKKVSLSGLHPNSVLLVFLRYSGCPWCNLTIYRLTIEAKRLKQNGCSVVAFIQSESENIKENIYKQQPKTPPFPIIADHERKIYDLYGIRDSVPALIRSVTKLPYWAEAVKEHGFTQKSIDGNFFLVPAMFLVSGRSGKILLAKYGSSFYEHETFTDVYAELGFAD